MRERKMIDKINENMPLQQQEKEQQNDSEKTPPLMDTENYNLSHKLNLLKQLKLTFESFLFYGSNNKNWNNFTGLQNIFTKNVYLIVQDDFDIKSLSVSPQSSHDTEINNNEQLNSQLITQLWSFINETFTKIPDNQAPTTTANMGQFGLNDDLNVKKHFLFIKNQMKSIKKQIFFVNDNENPVYEWIYLSLQMCNFYKQLSYLLKCSYLDCYYKKDSFLLDNRFVNTFLSYINAYETRDTLYLDENNDQSLKINRLNIKRLSYTSISEAGPSESGTKQGERENVDTKPSLLNVPKVMHRRLHSCPNVTPDKSIVDSIAIASVPLLVETNSSQSPLSLSISSSAATNEPLNDDNNENIESSIFKQANILDYIHELQNYYDSNLLDKENSHFLIADLAINTIELLKGKEEKYLFKKKGIRKKESLSPKSSTENQFDLRKFHLKSYSNPKFSSSLLNSVDSVSVSSYDISSVGSPVELHSQFLSNDRMSGDLLNSFEFNGQMTDSSSSSFESDENGEDGDDLNTIRIEVNDDENGDTAQKKQRRYSWELNTNDSEAENITKNLIKFYFNKKKLKNHTPKLTKYKDILQSKNEYSQFTQKFLDSYLQLKNESRPNVTQTKMALTKTTSVASSRLIGDDSWAPVREQLILNSLKQKQIKRDVVIKQQKYRCADCGYRLLGATDDPTTAAATTPISSLIKMFRYCEYYSKYFCRCCHVKHQSYIPSNVIFNLDFKQTYYVCKKAKHFLDKIFYEPLITLEDLNPSIFQQRNDLFARVKHARLKLYNCKRYITSCRFAYQLKQYLDKNFEDFLVNDTRVYSFDVLFKLKKTNYLDKLTDILNKIIEHILNCELCSQQAFICELCGKDELIYPFQIEHVCKCPNCLSCYHFKCFKSPEMCPKCERKRNRHSNTSINQTNT